MKPIDLSKKYDEQERINGMLAEKINELIEWANEHEDIHFCCSGVSVGSAGTPYASQLKYIEKKRKETK